MPHHDIVAIGGSAGALEAITRMLQMLPGDIPASILVALHIGAANGNRTPRILARHGPLPAEFARDGERLERGRVYVAPPDRHLLIIGDRLRLGAGPWENGSRPAIDPLFRSCALSCGPRVVGVLLSGTLSDGSSGLRAIERCGGIPVVQDPEDAAFGDMPRNALRFAGGARIVAADRLAGLLVDVVAQQAGPPRPAPPDLRVEVEIAADGRTAVQTGEHGGRPSLFTCPECHGAMREVDEGGPIRFRCHTGHAYTADSLQAALGDDLRRALGSALRVLDERVMLLRRLEAEAIESGHGWNAARWQERASRLVRRRCRVLINDRPPPDERDPAAEDGP
ncbi:MAG: chemotaxis protein CheB [Dongiaceae bacterium]